VNDSQTATPRQSSDPDEEPGTAIRFHYSDRFPQVLREVSCSLALSTYQAGQLVGVGTSGEDLAFAFRRFDRAMGVAVGDGHLAVAGKQQVWSLREHSEIATQIEPEGRHDRCWLPRTSTVTGEIQTHEIAWGRDAGKKPYLWVVNTLFSCLAGLDSRFSFVPRWRPPFISSLAAQDRCHLNGLAMRDGAPAFVTVMAMTDDPAGWRASRNDSGAVLDVDTGEAVTTGLSMPHSPRWHGETLYVLNSGLGRLEHVDLATGQREAVAAVPGYARGLALHAGLAFVGLSRIRETAVFGGAPIAAYHEQLRCGIGVIELATGNTIATLQFDNAVEEVFDVQVLPATRCPTFGANGTDDCWVLPRPGNTL
jgi:uncharacterized protein (TIGR03032 family)